MKIPPMFIEPMTQRLVEQLPDGEEWIRELKLDNSPYVVRVLDPALKGQPLFTVELGDDVHDRFTDHFLGGVAKEAHRSCVPREGVLDDVVRLGSTYRPAGFGPEADTLRAAPAKSGACQRELRRYE
jgi:hypothetical protein